MSKYLRADIRPHELIDEYLHTWNSDVFKKALFKRGWKSPRSKVLAKRLGVLIGVCLSEYEFRSDDSRQSVINAINAAFNAGGNHG